MIQSEGRWSTDDIRTLFEMSFNDLLFRAHSIHRQHFDPNAVQLSTLLSIKTGACSEDCGYCSQSARHQSEVPIEPLMGLESVKEAACKAKARGATRFCMGAAWRSPKDRDLGQVLDMVREVKALGLETCVTLGMLKHHQAQRLAEAGLDYYNHNLDTSPEYYSKVIHTHTYQDRTETLRNIRDAGIKVCCGGIIGMGESFTDRVELLRQLANLSPYPESVPINELVPVPGTPLAGTEKLDPFDFIRCIAVARILMPTAHVRLSAGRTHMNDQLQALCFFAGANSIFYGQRLLTTDNPRDADDRALLARLGMHAEVVSAVDVQLPVGPEEDSVAATRVSG